MIMHAVPIDVLQLIFSYLPAHFLCACSEVCKLWHDTCWVTCTTITLQDSSFTPTTFPEFSLVLQRVSKATTWEFRRCSFATDENLISLQPYLKNLKSLHLVGCHSVTTKICKVLTDNCKVLEELNIKDSTRITVPIRVEDLILPPTLLSLNVEGCIHLNDTLVGRLTSMCPRLQAIKLRGCYRVTHVGLLHILKNLPDLQLLDMKALKYITSYGFRILKELSTTLQRVSKLKTLDIRNCDHIEDDSIAILAEYCPSLSTIIVNFCKGLTDACSLSITKLPIEHLEIQGTMIADEGLNTICSGCTMMKVLVLRDCKEITSDGYSALAQAKNLQTLRVRSDKVDEDVVKTILQGCPNLVVFDLEGCANISEVVMKLDIKQNYPKIILH